MTEPSDRDDALDRPHPRMLTATGHVAPVPRRVRASVDGETVLDTTSARYLWEFPYYPQYVFAPDEFDDRARPTVRTRDTPFGPAVVHDVDLGDRTLEAAVWRLPDDAPDAVRGWWRVRWSAVDEWREEDEVVIVHPRSPYVRVDALPSSRHVVIEHHGVVVADSHDPVLLFETGLPTRYYLPEADVRTDLLHAIDQRTSCPYKGTVADYWDLRADSAPSVEQAAWRYDDTYDAVAAIRGRIAFLTEEFDVVLDGARQPRTRPVR